MDLPVATVFTHAVVGLYRRLTLLRRPGRCGPRTTERKREEGIVERGDYIRSHCFQVRQRRFRSSPLVKIIAFVCAVAVAPTVALSADFGPAPAPVAPPSQWRLSFTPYGWLTWLDGEQTVRGRSVDVKVDPIQVLDHLERVPFFGYGEARNGPIALYSDIF